MIHSFAMAWRRLAGDRTSTLIGVITTGAAIAVTVVVISLINAYLLRPPPHLDHPDRLVLLASQPIQISGGPPGDFFEPLSFAEYETYRQRARSFSGLAAQYDVEVATSFGERTEKRDAQLVSKEYFYVLGVRPGQGRFFSPHSDSESDDSLAIVISDSLWKRDLAGQPVLGKTIRVNGVDLPIIGIAPAGFRGVQAGGDVSLWASLEAHRILAPSLPDDLLPSETGWLLWFIARLRPGIDRHAAQEELAGIASSPAGSALTEDSPRLEIHQRIGVRPGSESQIDRALRLLLGVIAVTLLVACTNLASVILVNLVARRRELGIRMVIGATRIALVASVLAEIVWLYGGGSLLGIGLGALGSEVLEGQPIVRFVPAADDLSLDLRVLVMTLSVILAAVIAVAALPVARLLRIEPQSLLRGQGGDGRSSGSSRRADVLVVGQIAVCLLLLSGTGLLLLSEHRLMRVDPGFSGREVLNVRVDLGANRYSEARGGEFYRRAIERVEAIAGVANAAFTLEVPFTGTTANGKLAPLARNGTDGEPVWVSYNPVGATYFRTLGIPILSGRGFSARDDEGAHPVLVVNQSLDRLLGGDSLGRTVRLGGESYEVVGICGDVKKRSLDSEARAGAYVPLAQRYEPSVILQVRADGIDAHLLAAPVREAIWSLDRSVPLYDVEHLGDQIDASRAQQRVAAFLMAGCGLLALLLSMAGIYGLTAKNVSSRTREMGVRLALGARRSGTVRLLMVRGVALAAVGVGVGFLLTLWLGRLLESWLFGISPFSPVVLLLAAALCMGVTALAAYLPARQIVSLDPASILRAD